MAAADGLAETALLVLRERVVTYRYRPGARLSPDRLARELNIGATPMRVALALLHNDGFIEHEPRFGYRVRTPTRSDLRGLYVASNLLLAGAAHCGANASKEAVGQARAAVTGTGSARAAAPDDAARLFEAVAILAESDVVARAVRIANERLRFARQVEKASFADAAPELAAMRAALLAGRFDDLRAGVERYHDRRLASLEQIADAVFMQSFRASES